MSAVSDGGQSAKGAWPGDGGHPAKDVRLDDGVQNVDSLDAMEYAVERL